MQLEGIKDVTLVKVQATKIGDTQQYFQLDVDGLVRKLSKVSNRSKDHEKTQGWAQPDAQICGSNGSHNLCPFIF